MRDSRIPLIIDTDLSMGELGSEIDDGFALAVALAEPRVELLAVNCVHGNTDVETVSALTRDFLRRAGRGDIPVHPGAAVPLRRTPRSSAAPTPSASAAHAELLAANGAAAASLDRLVRERPGEIIVLAIGPLTNIAEAFTRSPELAPLIRELVVRGGVFQAQTGRADLPGEFNVWIDPDALAVVLRSGVKLRMVGLDVTERIRFSSEAARELAGPVGSLASSDGSPRPGLIGRVRAGPAIRASKGDVRSTTRSPSARSSSRTCSSGVPRSSRSRRNRTSRAELLSRTCSRARRHRRLTHSSRSTSMSPRRSSS